ncbi:FAD-dependent oxidoreductase, partial [Nocardia sp. NPDC057030]|uniref:FAD-dependent oxidoreductase n=1 Tax=Nocardia sp. NPDC057030 TaxID=3346005 RepID=UPI00362F8F39
AAVLPPPAGARGARTNGLPACTSRSVGVVVTHDLPGLPRPGAAPRYLVTLGDEDRVDPGLIIDRMVYQHPRYTPDSVAAQRRLGEIGCARVAFAGAYHGWGFHEDGALSGLRAAERLGARWTATPVAAVRTS